MRLSYLLVMLLSALCLLMGAADARPGKIPVNAIKKGAKAVGKGLRAINIAGTVNDIASIFRRRKKKH